VGVAGVEVGSGAGVAVVSMVALVAGFAGLAFDFSAPIKIILLVICLILA